MRRIEPPLISVAITVRHPARLVLSGDIHEEHQNPLQSAKLLVLLQVCSFFVNLQAVRSKKNEAQEDNQQRD